MLFNVRAIAEDHRVISTQIEAIDLGDAQRLAEESGLHLIAVRQAAQRSTMRSGRFSLLLFSQEVLALLRAGLTLTEVLDTLIEKADDASDLRILQRLAQGLREGRRYSEVLAEQKQTFPALYAGLMRAAEGTSNLPGTLERYIHYQTRVEQVRNKLISAAIYPCILALVGGAITLFLLGYVVPRFSLVYQESGREIPLLSQLMMTAGLWIASHWLLVLILMATGIAALAVYIQTGRLAALLARLVVKLPILGKHMRLYELSRMYLTLGMLLEGGMPITQALGMIEDVVFAERRTAVLTTITDLRAGQLVSDTFERNGLTTTVALRMIRVGERSGQLGEMLTQAAAFYEADISRFIDRFTRSVEPVLMAFLGLLIGGVVMLLYMPVFDLADVLQ